MEKLNGSERTLITGGAGFIGTNLVGYLSQRGFGNLVVLDNESLGDRRNIQEFDHEFIKGDIRDPRCLEAALRDAEIVVHLAADTRVMDSIADPVRNFDTNVIGTFQLLNLARAGGIRRIVVASTGGAILGEAQPPIHEEMVARPLAPYGASKLAAEGYCSAFCAAYGMSIICLRFSNVYGPGSFHKGSVVAHFFKRLMAGEDVVVYGDGSQKRDFLFVGDLMDGILQAIQLRRDGVFQFASGKATSINELLAEMRSVLGPQFTSRVIYRDFQAGEVRETWCDISKARRELGFNPCTTLPAGLRKTWDWFRAKGGLRLAAGRNQASLP